MQKYLITDGKQYIKKVHSKKYTTCSCPTTADQFTYKDAQNIINNNLNKALRKTFYIEGVEDFCKINPSEVDELMTSKYQKSEFSFDKGILEKIDNTTDSIFQTQIPDIKKLLAYKKDLENATSFYDKGLADIDHWIMEHKPAAHIRTKVYGIQHKIENERKEVKEKHGYVRVLIQATQENYSFDKLQKELQKAKYSQYKPNTYIYETLNELLV